MYIWSLDTLDMWSVCTETLLFSMLRNETRLSILHGYWLHTCYWLVAVSWSVFEFDTCLLASLHPVSFMKGKDSRFKELQKRRRRKSACQTADLSVHSRVSRYINARSSVSIVIVYRKGINMLTRVIGSLPCQQTQVPLDGDLWLPPLLRPGAWILSIDHLNRCQY